MKHKKKEFSMLSEDLKQASAELGQLADKVGQEDWATIKSMRVKLNDIAEKVQELEKNVYAEVL